MPIGKNALKRVSNNGYSKVNTSAPDMENSEITVTPEKKKAESIKQNAKPAAKPASRPTKKPAAPKKSAPTAEEKSSHPDGFVRIGLGDDMPIYLL